MTVDGNDREPDPWRVGQRLWLLLTAACVVGITGVNVYRAATQAITHDEAVTYERYCSGPFYRLVSSTDANNHVLHSLLCRLSVGLLGPSEAALRLPSVAAGLLFLAAVARIGSRVWGASLATPVVVLLVGLNPFVLDYLSIARGYSLALMLWAAALERLLAASQDPDAWASNPGPSQPQRRASQFLALAVLANLTFAPAAVGLAACWAAWVWNERRRLGEPPARTRAWLWSNLVRPGAIVFACLALPLVKLRPHHFYYGATSVTESLRSLGLASFAHHPQQWPIDTGSAWYLGVLERLALVVLPALALTLVALWVAVATALLRRPAVGPRPPEPGVMLFHLSAGSLTLTLLLFAGLHAAGMKLPLERTGLHLLTPFILASLSAGSALAALRPRLPAWLGPLIGRAAVAVGVLICAVWATQVQTGHYRPWLFDSDSRTVFRAILARHDPSSKQRVRVAATWNLAPCLNFYRDRYKADFIERVARVEGRTDYPPDADFFAVTVAYGGTPPPAPAAVLFHNPVTGTTLAAMPAARAGSPVVSYGPAGPPTRP